MKGTLVRAWELVSWGRVAGGTSTCPKGPYGVRRTVPLTHFAGCVVGEGPASVLTTLGVRPGSEVDFLLRLQLETNTALGVGLEPLWATAIEAVLGAAASAPERDAVFAYAGVGPQVDSGLLDVVSALVDDQVRAAGSSERGSVPAAPTLDPEPGASLDAVARRTDPAIETCALAQNLGRAPRAARRAPRAALPADLYRPTAPGHGRRRSRHGRRRRASRGSEDA